MKKLKWPLLIVLILLVAYFAGPKVESPDLSKPSIDLPDDPDQLQAFIDQREAKNPKIKPDNESQIIWADSSHQKTPYSLVYLHGWSASQEEGDPIHEEVARRYGMNLYLPRLAGHGLKEDEPMLTLTGTRLMQSAWEALEVGKRLGDKVIIMSTSTGGTLGLYLAGLDKGIAGLILYSPNIDMKDPSSVLLNNHWGLQLARLVVGGKYYEWEISTEREPYWTNKYRLEALTHLRELVDVTMTPATFQKVKQPVFLGYYYKNDTAQDQVVSVDAMLNMYDELGTPEDLKRKVAFPEAGKHVIACYLTSNAVDAVRQETYKYLEEVMGIQPKKVLKVEAATIEE